MLTMISRTCTSTVFIIAGFCLLLSVTSCNTLIQAGFDALDQSERNYSPNREQAAVFEANLQPSSDTRHTLTLYPARGPGNTRFVWIEQSTLPGMAILAQPGTDPSILEAKMLVAFHNWSDGWTLYEQEISGKLQLATATPLPQISSDTQLEKFDIAFASIRAGEKVIGGAQAIDQVGKRLSRIDALSTWMNRRLPAKLQTTTAFTRQWEPILFPELSQTTNYEQGSDKALEIRWDRAYTKKNFPEEMAPLRQTGTLYRDWLEARQLLQAHFQYESSHGILKQGYTLKAQEKNQEHLHIIMNYIQRKD